MRDPKISDIVLVITIIILIVLVLVGIPKALENRRSIYQADIDACIKAKGESSRSLCEYEELIRWGGRVP